MYPSHRLVVSVSPSFRSANEHIDSLGEVDVICDAEVRSWPSSPFDSHSFLIA